MNFELLRDPTGPISDHARHWTCWRWLGDAAALGASERMDE